MKIVTVLGTRPEIIRLSRVIEKLDMACRHVLVHTGQNYDPNLSEVFFRQLKIREPDYHLAVQADSLGEQVGQILSRVQTILQQERPDRLLILGDTNSGLAAFIAKRMGIPVFHMEAGNRCYDDRVPEEVNRRVIDHSSDVLMPYTERSRQNLLREGISAQRVLVTGNPTCEVLTHYRDAIDRSEVLADLGLKPKRFLLATLHRAENVDVESRLRNLTATLARLPAVYDMPVICSLHPRTRHRMLSFGMTLDLQRVRFLDPLGFFEFVALQQQAFCVLSDSGTVQEECCLLHVPSVTLRDFTERPETIECGSSILAGTDPERILTAVETVVRVPTQWTPPCEYLRTDVAVTVVKVLTSFLTQA